MDRRIGENSHQFSIKSRGKKKPATNSKGEFQLMHDPAYLDRAESANSASLPVLLRPQLVEKKTCVSPPTASPGDALREQKA